MNLINNPDNFVTTYLLYFASFISIMNPLGAMPIFLTMTSNLSEEQRNKTARKANITAFLTLVLFAFSGEFLFKFFGISVHSLRVVGGVIFFLIGYDMLQARISRVKLKDEEISTYVNDISITPLAIPLICGPGAITNAIVLMEDARFMEQKLILILAIFTVMLINFIIFRYSSLVKKMIGETGNNVLMRLMGLIIMVIAIEFLFAGLKPILQGIFNIA